ncbi:MAG TPA: nuclear transport factor 2 family protein [Sphingomonas sp.]|nr:nuclear transport factor 2 family protein [Sphingomonas sp.]
MRSFVLPLALLCTPLAAFAQTEEQTVRDADSAFWRAFNACDAAAMSPFFAEDVEFYHDITGLTRTRDGVVQSLVKGPCGTPGLHVRRALVADSVRVERVPGYGAILSGEHLFYARQGDGPERLATRARFTVIWHQEHGQWQMTRVISDAHQPVP